MATTKTVWIPLVLSAVLMVLGCSASGGKTFTAPDFNPAESRQYSSSHFTMGLWQFTADPVNGTLEAIQLRTGNFHLNALPFLEPPPYANLTIENIKFNGNIIDVDVGLRHPFLGLEQFTGFDVCGIMITNGSLTGFNDPGIRMSSVADTHLANADGYTRWWNPTEFPVNDGTIFSYNDGLLGSPYSFAHYNCTLNGYKYFCDDLEGSDDPLSDITLEKRGMFLAGQKNMRHYTIKLGFEGLTFNYAVDACWKFPQGGSPWNVPDDFPPAANRQEAYRLSVNETHNTLWNDGSESGGGLYLSIDVYDWFNADLNTVKVESPGNFVIAESALPVGGGAGYSTYEVDILDATPAQGSIGLLISVESESIGYGGLLPGKPVTAYFKYTAKVSGEEPVLAIYVDDSNDTGIEDGTKEHPFNTIQEGVDAAFALPEYELVYVDDSGNPYEEEVIMKSGVHVKSVPWDESDGSNRAYIVGPNTDETYSVLFNNVSNASIEGFRVGLAGTWDSNWGIVLGIEYRNIGIRSGASGILIKDCLFDDWSDGLIVNSVWISNSSDIEIANNRITLDGDCDEKLMLLNGFYGGNSANNILIRNNEIDHLWTSASEFGRHANGVWLEECYDITCKNNLFHHVDPHVSTGGQGGGTLLEGMRFYNSSYIYIINNTIDLWDSRHTPTIIAQTFAYRFYTCSSVNTFTNNIATNIFTEGEAPQGGIPLARGVQGVLTPVTCDFCDIWHIGPLPMNGARYYQEAVPGIGDLDANPLYIDPEAGDYHFDVNSPAQMGDPSFVDWDDTGSPSNNPDDPDANTRSRMGCYGGPGGEHVGLLTPE